MVSTGYPVVQTHALAHSPDPSWLRIWVGVFDEDPPDRLEWSLDGNPVAPADVESVRPLARADTPSARTHSGIVRLPLPPDPAGRRPERTVDVTARWGRHTQSAPSLRTRPLPVEVAADLGATFRVMLVSCFYRKTDATGQAGSVAAKVAAGDRRPDLVLTVGDQVYLDNPPPGPLHWSEAGYAQEFEQKYRANWQTEQAGLGYAEILRAAPVAAIPDDHEFWNNFPTAGTVGSLPWPGTWLGKTRERWADAATAMLHAFQLGAHPDAPDAYCYEIDVAPLSFFMMDNRTRRREVEERGRTVIRSLHPDDLARFGAWVDRMIATRGSVPVLVTGPSLLQPPSSKRWADVNAADVAEYPEIMGGLHRMLRAGCPPLALTGDVHYPRVSRARTTRAPGRTQGDQRDAPASGAAWPDIHEVISSPASLVSPQKDKKTKPARPHFSIEAGAGGRLACTKTWPEDPDRVVGNHVALLEFARRETGLELSVRYYRIADNGRCSYALPPIALKQRT